MLRFLPGIVLVQMVTLALFWVNQNADMQDLLMRVALPSALFACVTAFWFSALSRTQREQQLSKLREAHATEREKLNKQIERTRSDVLQKASADQAKILERANVEREKLVKKTHQEVLRTERSASRRASFKVGFAFTAVTAFGVVLLLSNLLTLGLLTITTAGGALGGYLVRWRQTGWLTDTRRLDTVPGLPGGDADFALAADDVVLHDGQKSLPALTNTPSPDSGHETSSATKSANQSATEVGQKGRLSGLFKRGGTA